MLSESARPVSQILPGPTQALSGTEGRLLQAFRSHHKRLESKNQYQPLDQSQRRLESVEVRNATGFFDTGLRQILTNGDFNTIVENKLEHQKDEIQSHLEALCAMLDRLVNVDLLSHDPAMPPDQDKACLYPRLSSLLQLLDVTSWDFELATGQGNILFRLASEGDAIEARDLVHRFNDFFSSTPQIPTRAERLEQPASAPWQRRNELRDRAVTGLGSLFSHVPREQSEECEGHQILVMLPDWESIGRQATELRPKLDLFLSTCSDSAKWHAAHCDVQPSLPLDGYDKCDFCDDLSHAHVSGNVFRLVASEGDLFIPCMDANLAKQRRLQPNRQPTFTLNRLLLDDSFVELQNVTPLMRPKKTPRFNRREKRSLAARLALCLSLYLDSEYTLSACDANNVFFINEDGRCQRNMIYVFSAVNDKRDDLHFDQSMAIYISLARLMLEIECGVSVKQKELHELKTWVDDMLLMDLEEERQAESSSDMIDIRSIEARKTYLAAVRDLLNFKQTYRRGSRRLRGEFYDIGTIAREIIFTDIAERIRSTIEPTNLKASGLADLKEELYQQNTVPTEKGRPNLHLSGSEGRVSSLSKPSTQRSMRSRSEFHADTVMPDSAASVDGKKYARSQYTVGILCALPKELMAVRALFDCRHDSLETVLHDSNQYALGQIAQHMVVAACLPAGEYGTNSATATAANITHSFPSIRFCLLVGIAGGVPSEKSDIRLGDVVVSQPTGTCSGVIQYDLGKEKEGIPFQLTGPSRPPPRVLTTAVSALRSDPDLRSDPLGPYLRNIAERLPEYSHPGRELDVLSQVACTTCRSQKVCPGGCSHVRQRGPRATVEPAIHYGPVASGNRVVKDAAFRDRLAREYGVLCFEMEAAGVVNTVPCLVIRGICDYCDVQKNDVWQEYAAATAAAYAKLLLIVVASVDDAPSGGGIRRSFEEPLSKRRKVEVNCI